MCDPSSRFTDTNQRRVDVIVQRLREMGLSEIEIQEIVELALPLMPEQKKD